MTPQRKSVVDALDAYFAGQISVAEAFRRAYETPTAEAAVSVVRTAKEFHTPRPKLRRQKTKRK
jgi:hypothetical protein